MDFAQVYASSSLKRCMIDAQLHTIGNFEPSTGGPAASEDLEQPFTAPAAVKVEFHGKRAAGFTRQLTLLLARFFRMHKRTRDFSVTRFATSMLLALVLGVVYLGADYSTYNGVNGGLGLIFLSVAFVGTISFASALPLAAADRGAFYRERAAQTYSSGSYLLASSLVEMPFAAAVALVYTCIFFPLVGFLQGGADGGAWAAMATHWEINTLLVLFQTFLAQLLVFALPSVQAAALVGTLCDCVCFLLMGYNPPASHVPAAYDWLTPVIPHKYVFSVLVSAVFGRCSADQLALAVAGDGQSETLPIGCRVLTDAPDTVGRVPVRTYVQSVFGADREAMVTHVGRLVALLAAARILAGLCMRFINHRRA
jgi:ABC-type multidrug transport system permease subunit